ncbi:hypothetical protein OT109_04250 [Phycisphaeraceae bacterium D3-23]
MTSVPFRVKKVAGGWAEADGLLVLDGQLLCFQFQTKDSVFGLIKTAVREVKVELHRVAEVRFKGKMLGGGVLSVRLADMKAGEGIPGQVAGVVELAVTKEHATAAQDLAASVNLEAAEARLRRTVG